MKILHFADLHLGVENYGHPDPATGLPGRMVDILKAFDELVNYAIQEKVDLVLFCGDAYKSREPNQTQQREFARRIKALSDAGIPVFLLIGNHDMSVTSGRASSTEIFDTLAVDNIHVSGIPEITLIATASGPVQVVSLPWLRRSAVISREAMRGLNLDEIYHKMEETLTGILEKLSRELDPEIPAILAAHAWVLGVHLGSEKGMSIGQEHKLMLSSIASSDFDYVALGHIHRRQVLSLVAPPVVYAGSLTALDFGDEGEEKGFYIIDIANKGKATRETAFQFHSVPSRRFLTINIDIDETDDEIENILLTEINKKETEINNAIVRLQVNLPASLRSKINDAAIKKVLQTASYYTIAYNVQRKVRTRFSMEKAEDLLPLDALKKYLEIKKAGKEHLKLVMQYGEDLINGEE